LLAYRGILEDDIGVPANVLMREFPADGNEEGANADD